MLSGVVFFVYSSIQLTNYLQPEAGWPLAETIKLFLRTEGFAEEFGDYEDIKYIDCIIAVHIIAFISLPVGHC